ncbi:MAG: sulfotransferase [Nitrococcus sp.]|nr:sulfotransferase [Nitrococcus sp.]
MSNYQPVVIIGAPRSGTNMLRYVLTPIPGVRTWRCAEIN